MSGRLPSCGPLLWGRHDEGNNMPEEQEPLTDEEVSKAMAEHTMLAIALVNEAMGITPVGDTEPIGGSSS